MNKWGKSDEWGIIQWIVLEKFNNRVIDILTVNWIWDLDKKLNFISLTLMELKLKSFKSLHSPEGLKVDALKGWVKLIGHDI